MRHLASAIILAALLGGCGGDEPSTPAQTTNEVAIASPLAAPPEPDLSACPKAEPNPDLSRTQPVPVPAAFAGLAKSDMDHFAFATADGSTICVDTTWIESIDGAKISDDDRFLSFAWLGY